MGQRLWRAKSKIRDAGIPFAVPGGDELRDRTASVLDAVYAAYGTGWGDATGSDVKRRGLTEEAIRLARLVVELLPGDAEARGLLAMMLHSEARRPARRAADGSFVPLAEQDVSRWSAPLMTEAEHQLAVAARLRTLGPYQLHAAIQSLHNRRALTGSTDWISIARLYDGLVELQPSIGAMVARAAAHGEAHGPPAGFALVDAIDVSLVASYQPYWVTRAHLLARMGDTAGARDASQQALSLTDDDAIRRYVIATLPTQATDLSSADGLGQTRPP
jgi:RNA polymerase sigma-70 factor (ECF subfamily)